MADYDFDVAVIGGGPGGYVAAIRAGQLGLRAALVEEAELGGICLNWGCIPSKALLKNAEVLSLFHRAEEFGITVDNLQYDFGKAIDRSRGVVRRLTAGVGMLLRKNKVEHVKGRGRLSDAHSVVVDGGERSFTAANVIIATGARPRPLPGLEMDGDTIIGSREALELRDVPSPVGIVGGGATGVEFAYLYRAYGAEVTVIELMPRLVPNEDEEIAQQLERAFSGQGIKTLTGSRVTSVEKRPDGAVLSVETPDGSRELEVQKVLVAVGVQGNVEDLGLEELGVPIERGFVQVDDNMRTGVPGVYAIGDVTGKLLLAHVAQAQGVLAIETIAGMDSQTLDYRMMPRAVYCQPQVTSFGYTEREAGEAGLSAKVGRFPFRANGKSLAAGDSEGMVKVVADGDTGEILGAHMIGAEVTEMLPELTMTNLLEGSVNELGWLVHSHPTLSEAVKEAALDVEGAAIHI
ncbi:MAG: dihydrolipoyl dehydrogenase [Chloroflexota bacterium]|nr:dihydrolipoyl dehydrogenase [Chloroflexota bacterium]MDE2941218.1 dihydrolipoyl dehydrogenase [Chloroflexota bacterium]MDE3267199.1 dihydrolipoyl dehydrogenase [Chloroflexota bacterium]